MSDLNARIKIKVGKVEVEAEGNEDFVKSQITQLAKEWFHKEDGQSGATKTEDAETGVTRQSPIAYETISEFYISKKPTTYILKSIVLGEYVEKKEKKDFTGADVIKAYNTVRETAPRNIHDVLKSAYKAGYLIPGDKKGTWKLSRVGEETVKALPGLKTE